MIRTAARPRPPIALAAIAVLALTACGTGEGPDSSETPTSAVAYDAELHALLPAEIQEAGTAAVGAPYALRPSIFTDDAGDPRGAAVDLAAALGEVLGIEFDWRETADPVTALQSGAIDVSMGFLSDSPAREEVLTMVPQFLNTSTLLVAAGSEVTDIESLCGSVLAVVSGSQQERRAAEISAESCGADPIEITPFAAARDAIPQVQSGRAAAFAAPRMVLEGVVDSSDGAFAVTDADYADYPFAMGVALDRGGFADALAGALAALETDGRYAEILDTWDIGDLALTQEQIGVNTGSTAAFSVNE